MSRSEREDRPSPSHRRLSFDIERLEDPIGTQYHTPSPPHSFQRPPRGHFRSNGPPPPPSKCSGVPIERRIVDPVSMKLDESPCHYTSSSSSSSSSHNVSLKVPYTETEAKLKERFRKHGLTKSTQDEKMFTTIIEEFLETGEDPCHAQLALAANSSDLSYSGKNTFSYRILKTPWFKDKKYLTPALQKLAFKSFVSGSKVVMEKAVSVFRLTEIIHSLRSEIDLLSSKHKYIEAFVGAKYLGILDTYDDVVERFLVPLILINRSAVFENDIQTYPKICRELLSFLDDLYEDTYRKVSNLCKRYRSKKEAIGILTGKALGKLIQRYLKLYNLENDIVPRHQQQRIEGAFRYHLGTIDDSSLENWRELVQNSLDRHPYLVPVLMNFLIYNRHCANHDEAAYWVKRLGISEQTLNHKGIWKRAYNLDNSFSSSENWDVDDSETSASSKTLNSSSSTTSDHNSFIENKKTYHQLSLPPENIILVTSRNFDEFLSELKNGPSLTGYDSEFRPNLSMETEKVSIIQIAFQDRVYILDMLELVDHKKCLTELYWHYFMDEQQTILGYGITSDLTVLSNTDPIFANVSKTYEAKIIELCSFEQSMKKRTLFTKFPYKTRERGLSGLVEALLGSSLDKTNQRSNWDKRPLKTSQIEYAALDAFVLLEIFFKFKNMTGYEDPNKALTSFESVVKSVASTHKESASKKTEKIAKKKKKRERKKQTEILQQSGNESPVANESTIQAKDIRVVCDTMLHGLGKKLRSYGIDTVNVENSDVDTLLKIARDESRVVLTRGKMAEKLSGHLPHGRVLNLVSGKSEEQVKHVIDFFRIVLNDENMFSICTLCNGNKYITLNRQQLSSLRQSQPLTIDDDDDDNDGVIQIVNNVTNEGVTLNVWQVPDGVVENNDQFYICAKCGHVYWEGSHWNRTKVKMVRLRGHDV